MNVALVYVQPKSDLDRDRIEKAYMRLCQPMLDVLSELGGVASLGEVEDAFCDGRFNVNLDGRKMVGTAQRWRQSQGGQRPVVLAHDAMLLDNERVDMVNAVNRFNQMCDVEQRCRAESHVALHELFAAPDFIARLGERYADIFARL